MLVDVLSNVGTRVAQSPAERLGQKHEPQRFGLKTWLKVVPSIWDRFRIGNGGAVVPEEFWNEDQLEDGRPVAVIACPCGAEPVVALGNFHFCSGEGCKRVFVFLGEAVRSTRLTDEELAAEE